MIGDPREEEGNQRANTEMKPIKDVPQKGLCGGRPRPYFLKKVLRDPEKLS